MKQCVLFVLLGLFLGAGAAQAQVIQVPAAIRCSTSNPPIPPYQLLRPSPTPPYLTCAIFCDWDDARQVGRQTFQVTNELGFQCVSFTDPLNPTCNFDLATGVYRPNTRSPVGSVCIDGRGQNCGSCNAVGECISGALLGTDSACEGDNNYCTLEECRPEGCRPAGGLDCRDTDTCTVDTCDSSRVTNPAMRQDACVHTPGVYGDPGCGQCGDGIWDRPFEQCDDGNRINFDSCTSMCVVSSCGDSFIQGTEECDDGNTINDDGCTNSCLNPRCGDGIRQPWEECDLGAQNGGDQCTLTCQRTLECPSFECVPTNPRYPLGNNQANINCAIATTAPGLNWSNPEVTCSNGLVQTPVGNSAVCNVTGFAPQNITLSVQNLNNQRVNCPAVQILPQGCGDRIIQPGETCDDGNLIDTDVCRNSCVNAQCGDGVVQTGIEQCDDGDQTNNNNCTNACTTPRCGDGILQVGEVCDDGNNVNTDTCLNTCQQAQCGDGFLQVGIEVCDDGNRLNADACLNTCQQAQCGDGFIQLGVEVCDDGNTSNTDGCTNRCAFATCGDGFVQTGEACDDGNTSNTDACLNSCRIAQCGDGVVQTSTEQCDDGNIIENDACRNNCEVARCGDGVVQPGEDCDDGNTLNNDTCSAACRMCSPEICDGADNDCDGVIDNGNPGGGTACNTGIPGACAQGTEVCQNGRIDCVSNVGTAPDNGTLEEPRCNLIDDDCDGQTDEGCNCTGNETRLCGTDVGECRAGIQNCVAGRFEDTCNGSVGPSPEICDGLDNDCDGLIDEDLGTISCGTGLCAVTVDACVNGQPNTCVPQTPGEEICDDLLDNDCDGFANENCERGCIPFDQNGDGIDDVCLTPSQGCLAGGGQIEKSPVISINDIIASQSGPVSLESGYVVDNGMIIGRCVSAKAGVKLGGNSLFSSFGLFEFVSLSGVAIYAFRRRRRT